MRSSRKYQSLTYMMDSVRELLNFKKYKDDPGHASENEVKYEQVEQTEDDQAQAEPHVCSRCQNGAHKATSRKRVAVCVLVTLIVTLVWPALITLYLRKEIQHHNEPKLLIEQCKSQFHLQKKLLTNTRSSHGSHRLPRRYEIRKR